jgi:YbbR domain-containing protein
MSLYQEYIRKDIKLKLLSLLLAGMLWFAVSYVGESKMNMPVKVPVESLNRDYILGKLETDEIFVTVSGPVSILKQLRSRDVRLVLDLSTIKEGRHTISVEKKDIELPKGVQVDSIRPDYVVMEIDRVLEKQVRTVVRLEQKWSTIYKVKSWSPRYVNVEGPRTSLERLTALETLPVSGPFSKKEEELYVGFDTGGITLRSIKPDMIRVVVRRN